MTRGAWRAAGAAKAVHSQAGAWKRVEGWQPSFDISFRTDGYRQTYDKSTTAFPTLICVETNVLSEEPRFSTVVRWLYLLADLSVVLFLCYLATGVCTSVTDRWLLVGVLFLWYLPRGVASVGIYVSSGQLGNRRPSLFSTVACLLRSAQVLCVLGASYGRLWTLESVGFSFETSLANQCLAGLAGAICFKAMMAAYRRRYFRLYGESANGRNTPSLCPYFARTVRAHLPRGRLADVLDKLSLIVVGPIVEEVICRGFFVYAFGELVGAAIIGVYFGLAIFALLHVYHGPGSHVAIGNFYCICIALLYLFGIQAAIIFHILLNGAYAVSLKKQSLRYLEFQRWRRSQRGLGSS